ncbi:hypothetical protein [Pseudomonas sp. CMR5c]|nr:hypothetical protein [Pseudomonas sp. CMR5c]
MNCPSNMTWPAPAPGPRDTSNEPGHGARGNTARALWPAVRH